jgi:cystathionine gamma-synthase
MSCSPNHITRAVRAGIGSDAHHGAVIPPIHLSSNYTFAGFDRKREYDYTRSGNPTRDQLATALAELEGGGDAVVTSSGMSAVALVLKLLRPDDLLLAPHDCYGGTYRAMSALARKGHFRVEFADLTQPQTLKAGIALNPSMIWVETPSNPLLRITDLDRLCKLGHAAGALVVADNTFLSPALQRPIEFGADVVVHSTTKYLNGHSDVVGGAVISRDAGLHEELAWWANCIGLTGAPFDSYLTLRGLRTLHARMRVHLENAAAIVDALCGHDAVTRVFHPSLPDHRGHDIAARQQFGFGAMISFELRGGAGAVAGLVDELRHFTLAESLGGVESLIAHPATMTHASMPADARAAAGISDSLLRISVGIESADDLIADLRQGLDRVGAKELSDTDTTHPPAAPAVSRG